MGDEADGHELNGAALTMAITLGWPTPHGDEGPIADIRAHNSSPGHGPLQSAASTEPNTLVAALRRELLTQRRRYQTQIDEPRAALKQRDQALAAARGEIQRRSRHQTRGRGRDQAVDSTPPPWRSTAIGHAHAVRTGGIPQLRERHGDPANRRPPPGSR